MRGSFEEVEKWDFSAISFVQSLSVWPGEWPSWRIEYAEKLSKCNAHLEAKRVQKCSAFGVRAELRQIARARC